MNAERRQPLFQVWGLSSSQCLHDSQESMIRDLVPIIEKRLEQYELELLGRVDRDEDM